jgi:hypothetical protein
MRLQIRLPATAIWNYPTIDLLSQRILQILASHHENEGDEVEAIDDEEESRVGSPADVALTDILDELDDMTDEEARKILSSGSSVTGAGDE